jgi:superfamily II DNA or RNA helicase
MVLIPAKSFDTVSASDLESAFNGELAKGRELAPRLRELRRTPSTLLAKLDGARVALRADSKDIADADCSFCDNPCGHVAAALLAWIDHRDRGRKVRAPRKLDPIDRDLAAKPRDLAAIYFQGAPVPSMTVDLDGGGPALNVVLESGDLRASFRIPGADAPAFLWNLPPSAKAPKGLRVARTPLIPELRADYDESGRLQLQPYYGRFGVGDLERGLAGTRWFFDGTTYHPLATVPKKVRGYFAGSTPLLREGDAIPEFLKSELPDLTNWVAFRPSPAVRESTVSAPPKLAAVSVASGPGDWLVLDPVYASGDHRVALHEILALQRPKGYIRRGTTWIPVDARDAHQQWGARTPNRLRRADYLAARATLKKSLAVEPLGDVRALEEALDHLDDPRPEPLPAGLRAELRPYQKAGYDWLWTLRRAGLNGVLADDMGLGKTHQTMAFLLSMYERGATRPSLIVCPTSVLDTWLEKIRVFAPGLRPYRYHGTRKPEMLALPGLRAVVTTYSVLSRDSDLLARTPWECVVLDEAQYIKTSGTRCAQAARALDARTRLALTGTPVENRLDELWSIFEFLQPGYLGSAESFRKRFEIPIVREENGAALERLRRLIHPFKLRRVKEEVLADLPAKVEDVRWCELTAPQAALYRALLEKEGGLVDNLRREGVAPDYVSIFATLTKLKRICDHPALVLDGSRTRELQSGKFEAFAELMDESLRSGHKVVVFTQYLEMMDLIEDWLRGRRIRFAEIRGNTRDRAAAIKAFNDDAACRVFVCSLMAGGVGIDLTAASVVIHYDRWWNAAREDQATDRVHRIGQTRGVQVFKLVTRGTLEEKIDRMISAKGELMNNVVQSDVAAFKRLTRDDLAELLSLEERSGLSGQASASEAVSQ